MVNKTFIENDYFVITIIYSNWHLRRINSFHFQAQPGNVKTTPSTMYGSGTYAGYTQPAPTSTPGYSYPMNPYEQPGSYGGIVTSSAAPGAGECIFFSNSYNETELRRNRGFQRNFLSISVLFLFSPAWQIESNTKKSYFFSFNLSGLVTFVKYFFCPSSTH